MSVPSISRRRRFAVLHRDLFSCRYCGRAAVDGVILEVDHVIPRSAGGTNDMENLVTACWDCNRGKRHYQLGRAALVLGNGPDPDPDFQLKFLLAEEALRDIVFEAYQTGQLDQLRGEVSNIRPLLWSAATRIKRASA